MKSSMQEKIVCFLGLAALLWFFGAGVVRAQNVQPALPDVQINWASPTEAMDRLSSALLALEQQVQAAGPSSPLVYKLKYYTAVYSSIEQGVAVPTAVDANYGLFVSGVVDIPVEYPNPVPLNEWQEYRRELTQMLQN